MVSIGRGNLIVEALEKYKEKNKIYPDDLDNLVPNYIENIPKTDIDDLNFIYLVDEKNENYTLDIIVEPSGLMLLGAKSIKRLGYCPSHIYPENQYTKNHFIYDGWVLQTINRNYHN